MLYAYEESVLYAIDLFCDTRLFGQPIRLQNRATGAGIPSPHQGRSVNGRVHPTTDYSRNQHLNLNAFSVGQPIQNQNSSQNLQMQHLQAQHMQMQQEFQPWQYNSNLGYAGPLLNMYMNAMGSPAPMPSSSAGSTPPTDRFIPPFLPPPPGVDIDPAISRDVSGNRNFQNMQFTINNTNYQGHQNHGSYDRGRGDRHDRKYSNFDSKEDRSRNRDDRSRSNDRSRSRGYDSYDRRRR